MAWRHFRDERGKSKAIRQCDLCCEMIQPDEERVKRFGIDAGEFVRMDMHVACEALTRGWDAMDWETFSPGDPDFMQQLKGGE